MSLSRHPLTPNPQGLANIPVDSGTVALLAASFRAVQARGQDFADGFYARLFAAHPQVRAMFPADMTAQKAKLLDTLTAVMAHLQDPQGNVKRLQELGVRHVAYGARPEHFALVIDAMLGAMQDVAGKEWNKAVHEQWRRALSLIAEVMIKAGLEHGPRPGDAPATYAGDTPPLKRHASLQPFSREHMGALVLARNLRRRPLNDAERKAVVAEFAKAWELELSPHFADEERVLVPIIADSILKERLLADHARLRELAAALASASQPRDTEQLMQRLGDQLDDHIRWEERVLFETIQARAPDALARLHVHAEQIERDRPGARPRRPDRS
jgi:hemoglobin-like flavoprotein/hemerythrin-like domain-containing protein